MISPFFQPVSRLFLLSLLFLVVRGAPPLKRHDQGLPAQTCRSVQSFCDDFIDKCIVACSWIHHASSKSRPETDISHRCQYNGLDYYAIDCICGSTDITSTVLGQLAGSDQSSGGSPHTVTNAVEATSEVTVTHTKIVGATAASVKVIISTSIVPAIETDVVTIVVPAVVTRTEVETDHETQTTVETDFSTILFSTVVVQTETDTIPTTVTSTGTVFVTDTTTEIDVFTTTSTGVTTIFSTERDTVTDFISTTIIIPTLSVIPTIVVGPSVFSVSVIPSTRTLATSTRTIVSFTRTVTSTSTAHPLSTTYSGLPSHTPVVVRRKGDGAGTVSFSPRDGNDEFCQSYGSACTELCGGSVRDIRTGLCGKSGGDNYQLSCICKNGQDDSQVALCAITGGNSGGGGGGTKTVTVTSRTTLKSTATHDITRVRTVFTTTTKTEARKTRTHTVQATVTSTRFLLGSTSYDIVDQTSASTLFETVLSTSITTVPYTTTTTTTDIIVDTDVVYTSSTRSIFSTATAFVTETTIIPVSVTSTVEVTASTTSTLVIPATRTETDFATVITTATVVVPTTSYSPILTTSTASIPGTTSIGVSASVRTVDVATTTFIYATTTSVVPFTTVTVITPVGILEVDQGQGYLSTDVVQGGGGGGIARTFTEADALRVVMISAQSSGNAVYLYALNSANDIGATEHYVGLAQFPGEPNSLSGEFFSDGPALTFVAYAPYGPATQIRSAFDDNRGNPGAYAEAVVFSFNPSNGGLSLFWVNEDNSVFPLLLEIEVPNQSGGVQFIASYPFSYNVIFVPIAP